MRRPAGLLALLLAGCQSFGAFSSPTTLPRGAVRVGASGTYDAFHVTDQRTTAADLSASLGIGLTDRTELDLLASPAMIDVHLKQAFLGRGRFALSAAAGLGAFTAYTRHTFALYAPVELVAGVRPEPDITVFLGPKIVGGVSLDPPAQEAGFDRGDLGLLVGGVAGVGLESPRFTFCPQITVLTPVATGARGTVVQINLGVATQLGSE